MQNFNYAALEGLIPLFGGVWITLITWGLIKTSPEYQKRYGRLLKFLGPALVLFGLILLGRGFIS